jgi:hypothetical protein
MLGLEELQEIIALAKKRIARRGTLEPQKTLTTNTTLALFV